MKKKPLPPRRLRMNRQSRLMSAKSWIDKYPGKNIVIEYRKHFGVSPLCAAYELKIFGLDICQEYIDKLKLDEEAKRNANEKRKLLKKEKENNIFLESDETYYFIAGYTSNGVSFGITWEEHEKDKSIS